MSASPMYERPAELLQNLIRFDTTNPPGNEAACIGYIDGLLQELGIQTTILARDDNRPNLIARLKGRGDAPPLLVYGHVDVVTTAGQEWTYPPFAAKIHDGYIWGRGALDMKGPVAMYLSAFMRAHAEKLDLPGDVILALVADEENLGIYGAGYLVDKHPGLFEGVRYALGEFGGFTLYISGKRFYPIMIAEKQVCWMKTTLHGPGGHGAMPVRGGALAAAAEVIQKLDRHRLPVHITPAARLMFGTLAKELPFPQGAVIGQLFNPLLTDTVLNLLGDQKRIFGPLFHNTATPTIVHAGEKINVIPNTVTIELDGRLLPGCTRDDLIREVRQVAGRPDLEFEIVDYFENSGQPDMALFETLGDVLKQADPEGIPLPLFLPAVTDGRFFSQLGIQTYGFSPMQLDPAFNFINTIHAANERIPVEAVGFGAEAVYRVLGRFGGTK